jgi:hypothetical protein
MKNKWDLEGILNQEHYRSIINLTSKYQDKEDGLRQFHYRWALIKNHDNIDQTSFKNELQEFFQNPQLEYFEKKGYIKTGCIKGKYPNNNLTNFLKKLSDPNEYGILVKHKDKDNITRYKVSNKFYDKLEIYEKIEMLKSYDNIDHITSMLHRFKDEKQGYMQHIEASILGVNDDLESKLDKEDIEELQNQIMKALEASVNISAMNTLASKTDSGILLFIDTYTEKIESFIDRLADRKLIK